MQQGCEVAGAAPESHGKIPPCMSFTSDLTFSLQAAEAEASREARAKVIAADGEMRASKALREASQIIEQSPAALQLRYLQVGSCVN